MNRYSDELTQTFYEQQTNRFMRMNNLYLNSLEVSTAGNTCLIRVPTTLTNYSSLHWMSISGVCLIRSQILLLL